MNHQVLLLFCINLFSAMGYSLIAPLYPTLGEERHINEEVLGWIISVYALFNFLVTPFTPYLSNKFGRKNIFYFATISEASCTLFYGILHLVPNYYLLIILSFIARVIHGTGSGITATLVYSLTSSVSEPENIKVSLGYMEVAWSLGVACGPLLGSFFYHLGGYSLPFYALGLSLFISVFLIHYLDLPMSNEEEETPNFIKLLNNFYIMINLFTVVVYLFANTYYFPSLTNHLTHTWGLSVEVSSIFFIINMLTYFITLQFLDAVTNRLGFILTIWVGIILIMVGALFVYPIDFLPQFLICIILGLAMIGASGAAINVPCLMEMGRILKKDDPSIDEFLANDISSAMYNFGVNIGDFSGPIFGGFISERYGFKYSCIAMSLIALVFGLFYMMVYGKTMVNDFMSGGQKQRDEFSNRLMDDYDDFGTPGESGMKIGVPMSHRRHTSHSSVHRISIGSSQKGSISNEGNRSLRSLKL